MRWFTVAADYQEGDHLTKVVHTVPAVGGHLTERDGQCWCDIHKMLFCWPSHHVVKKSIHYIHEYQGEPRYGNQQSRPG